jgi:thioredoxin-related protein
MRVPSDLLKTNKLQMKLIIFFALYLTLFFQPKTTADSVTGKEIKVDWLTIEEAEAKWKKKKKKVFIDVYTDWCGWCKRMDATTFSHPVIAEYLNANFYPVKFNAEDRNNVIFNGQVYKYNEKYRSHDLAIEWLGGKMSYPTTVYLDEDMKLIQPLPGYLKADEFEKIIYFIGENHYRKLTYEAYQKVHKSNL